MKTRTKIISAIALTACSAGIVIPAFGIPDIDPGSDFDTNNKEDLTGFWKSVTGGQLEFRKDGFFSADNVRIDPHCTKEYDLGRQDERSSGTRKWKFGSYPDEGNGVIVEFTPTEKGFHDCKIYGIFQGTSAEPEMQLHQDMGTPEFT